MSDLPTSMLSALESTKVFETTEAIRMAKHSEGPFMSGIRVHCPLRGFGLRKSKACVSCPHWGGIAERVVIGPKGDDPKSKAQRYLVVCAHPVARSLQFCPED